MTDHVSLCSLCVSKWLHIHPSTFFSVCDCAHNTPKGLSGQFRVKPAKSLAQINRRGQRQPLRARVVGAVAPIRKRHPGHPALHSPWLARDNRADTHAQTDRHTQGYARRIPTHNLVAYTYATQRQTSSISCNRGLSVLLEVSNMHEGVEVSVS